VLAAACDVVGAARAVAGSDTRSSPCSSAWSMAQLPSGSGLSCREADPWAGQSLGEALRSTGAAGCGTVQQPASGDRAFCCLAPG